MIKWVFLFSCDNMLDRVSSVSSRSKSLTLIDFINLFSGLSIVLYCQDLRFNVIFILKQVFLFPYHPVGLQTHILGHQNKDLITRMDC